MTAGALPFTRENEDDYISEPRHGSIVYHEALDTHVYITKGRLFSNGRLSNMWYWRRIKKDGSVSKKEEHGYGGSFLPAKHKYKIHVDIRAERMKKAKNKKRK